MEKEALGEEECEGALEGGNCRIRRSPEGPRTKSWSTTTGDVAVGSSSFFVDPASKEKRICAFSDALPGLTSRFPVLRFFGICRLSDGDLAMRRGKVGSPSVPQVNSCHLRCDIRSDREQDSLHVRHGAPLRLNVPSLPDPDPGMLQYDSESKSPPARPANANKSVVAVAGEVGAVRQS